MTQKEAIGKALKKLGGRATLKDIYPLALAFGDFSGSKNKEATIRNCLLTSPKSFRHSPDKPEGWYELISFQDEIAERDNRIAELEAQLEVKDKKIQELKQQETVESFLDRMVDATKTVFATKRNDARPVQQVLVVMNRPEHQDLMQWIIGNTSKAVNKTITKKIIQKTINKGNTYVNQQTVIPSVGNFKPQISTQNMSLPMPPSGNDEQRLLENESGRR